MASKNCCRRKRVRAGLDRNPDRQTLVQICAECARIFSHRCEIFLPPDGNDLKPLAIHGDLDLMGIFHAPQEIEGIAPEPDLDQIFAIERERVRNQDSTASAQR